ncbi:hypothetical protein [Prevotella denticola]|nr:hypothetical protein [Prevotella denticola]
MTATKDKINQGLDGYVLNKSTSPVGTVKAVASLQPFTSICKKIQLPLSAASSAMLFQEESWICLFKRLASL